MKQRPKKARSVPSPGNSHQVDERKETPMSGRRRWLMRLAAATLVPLFLLGVLELGLRLSGYGYPTRLFLPLRIGGEDFLDGGVANESPFDHWLDDPTVHTIVVHRIRHTSEMGGLPWRTPGGILGACHGVAANELHRRRCEQAEGSGKRLVFLETGHECPGLLHRGKARGYFAAGEKTGREWGG